MKNLALSIAHVALQFRQQRNGCSHWHVLKHVFLPVLAQCACRLRHFGGQVAGNDFLLLWITYHLQDALTVGVDHLEQMAAFACTGRQHNLTGSLQIVLGLDVIDVGILAISLNDDCLFQLLCKVV